MDSSTPRQAVEVRRGARAGVQSPTIPVERIPIRREPRGKRLVDLLLSTAMLVATSPAWILIALAIKLDDGGPVFYAQERHGRLGRRIRILKFRSMIPDSDERYGLLQARESDDRVTRVGRVLRRFGLDELPQILSIWKGDMSFVGPRPLAVGEIVEDGAGGRVSYESMLNFWLRLSVRPGLTSLATIYLPKDVHPARKFRYDQAYVRLQSLPLDLRLIALSYWISLTGRWEHRQRKI